MRKKVLFAGLFLIAGLVLVSLNYKKIKSIVYANYDVTCRSYVSYSSWEQLGKGSYDCKDVSTYLSPTSSNPVGITGWNDGKWCKEFHVIYFTKKRGVYSCSTCGLCSFSYYQYKIDALYDNISPSSEAKKE